LDNLIVIRERMIAAKRYDARYDSTIAELEAKVRDENLRAETGLLP